MVAVMLPICNNATNPVAEANISQTCLADWLHCQTTPTSRNLHQPQDVELVVQMSASAIQMYTQ